jgi:hypothetical protein
VGISPESWAELDTNWQKVAAQVWCSIVYFAAVFYTIK